MNNTDKIPQYSEVETKYRTTVSMLPTFKRVAESIQDLRRFTYAEGPDEYFVNPKDPSSFARIRYSEHPDKDGKYYRQLSRKKKFEGHKDNVFRQETNLFLSENEVEEIRQDVKISGSFFNFKIHKYCHIYDFKDATIVFYSVREEGTTKEDFFIEIEVDEKTIHNLTEKEAWDVIHKYEKILEPVGVVPDKRLKKSLFEMYRKDVK